MKRSRKGFTLVELLVVIGLIAVLAGVLGLALGRGNSGAALQSSQSSLQGLFASARAQAALNQATASIIVNADPFSDGYLREFYVVVGSTIRGGATILSPGVHLVPNSSSSNPNVQFTSPPDWTNRTSGAFADTPVSPLPTELSGGTYRNVVGITSLGRRNPATGSDKLVLAAAERVDADTISFANPDAVRGVQISIYGVLTFLNNTEAMD